MVLSSSPSQRPKSSGAGSSKSSAAPAERRTSQQFPSQTQQDMGHKSPVTLYQRVRKKSNSSHSKPDSLASHGPDLFAPGPFKTPLVKAERSPSFTAREHDTPLQRKGSLLNEIAQSQDAPNSGDAIPKSSVEGDKITTADKTSLKALRNLGVAPPTRSAKAASVLTGFQPPPSPTTTDQLQQRKNIVSFASSEFSADDEFSHGGKPGTDSQIWSARTPSVPSRLPPRNFKPSEASSLSSSVAVRHRTTLPFNSMAGDHSSSHGKALPTTGLPGSSKTLACAYIVGGLPKQPSHWTVAEHDVPPAHSEGALDRWWKPEVLGSSVVGEHISLDDLDGGKSGLSKGKGRAGKSATTGIPALSASEVAKIQSKALKLSFTRECEVMASTLAPPAASHYFSFTVPVDDEEIAASGPGGAGQQFDLIINSTTARQSFSVGEVTRYYAVSLQIWSHADKSRALQIRQSLAGGQRKERAHALKAASQGRRFGKRLEQKLASNSHSIHSAAETDVETDAFMSETDADLPRPAHVNLNNALPLWLPYHLILVSRWPLFDVMTDYLRVHWARFNTAIAQHSLAMSQLLNTPAPRPGGDIKVSAGAPEVVFCAKMPGKMDIANEGFVESNNTCWPLFSCLSADHLLTICEVALSPMGRVIFFSRHNIMLSMAVETFTYILELKGWSGVGGVAHHQVHARDIRLLIEDPGPYILGVHTSCRSITSGAPKEVLKVDLDMDELECGRFHPGALSSGRQREKDIKTLEAAIDRPANHVAGVPREWAEAYPAGRFRPLSVVEANGRVTSAERLLPPSNWTFNSTSVFAAFDAVLSKQPSSGLISIFKKQVPRRLAKLDPSTAHVQSMIRSHTSTFVNRRDHLETKLWKLNRRMTSLASEAATWAKTYETFSSYSKSLAKQQEDLKNRLDREKKEARRLSAQVNEQKHSHSVLQKRLKETEEARATAERELLEASRVREELEGQRQRMIQELSTAIISGIEDPERPSSAASVPIYRNESRGLHRRSSSLGSVGSNTLDSLSEDGLNPEERKAMEERQAAQEAMAQLQARLQAVLRIAKSDEMGSLRSTSAASGNKIPLDTSDEESGAEDPHSSVGHNDPPDFGQVPPSPRSTRSRISRYNIQKQSSDASPDQDSEDHTESLRHTTGEVQLQAKKKKKGTHSSGRARSALELTDEDTFVSAAGSSDSSVATSSTKPSVPAISINGKGRSASASPVTIPTRPVLTRSKSTDKSNSDTDTTQGMHQHSKSKHRAH